MKYLFALLIPPIGLWMADKPGQAIWNALLWLTIIGWLPAAVWSCWGVASDEADVRTDRLISAINPSLPPLKRKKIKEEPYWC